MTGQLALNHHSSKAQGAQGTRRYRRSASVAAIVYKYGWNAVGRPHLPFSLGTITFLDFLRFK